MDKYFSGLILVSSLVIGCSPSEETSGKDSDVIKIGIFEPLTGANAAEGAMEVRELEWPMRCSCVGERYCNSG